MDTEEIKVTITELPDIKKLKESGGLLIVRMDRSHPMHEAMRLQREIRTWLDVQKLPGVGFLVVGPGTNVETIDEEAMNRMGWYRNPPDFNSPALVEMSVREDGKVVWVNVDGKCALRASQIQNLVLQDERDTAKTSQDHR